MAGGPCPASCWPPHWLPGFSWPDTQSLMESLLWVLWLRKFPAMMTWETWVALPTHPHPPAAPSPCSPMASCLAGSRLCLHPGTDQTSAAQTCPGHRWCGYLRSKPWETIVFHQELAIISLTEPCMPSTVPVARLNMSMVNSSLIHCNYSSKTSSSSEWLYLLQGGVVSRLCSLLTSCRLEGWSSMALRRVSTTQHFSLGCSSHRFFIWISLLSTAAQGPASASARRKRSLRSCPQKDKRIQDVDGPWMDLFKKADMRRRQCKVRAETATTWPQVWSTSGHQELEKVKRTIPLSLQREHRPADIFMSDF